MQVAPHREQLVTLLCEAAEIEHCLMGSYLYAAFSLKQDEDEGLTAPELQAVRRWRREVIGIATDEMLHLALVNNLLIALGAPPHYRRVNFPIAGGLFPAGIGVALAPLDEATLDHFVYVERPRDVAERDGAGFARPLDPGLARRMLTGRLMGFSEDYGTVGELYETIGASFTLLHQSLGGDALFVGPQDVQLGQEDFRLPGLKRIATLADAHAAIELIVRQGEGSPAELAGSHYARFVAIRSEWQALKAARRGFVPYRPAARNPVMRTPVVADRVQVLAEPASRLLDAGNAAYVLMLRLLCLLSDERLCRAHDRRPLADQTLMLMHLVADIGSLLTRLPAQPGREDVHAGLTFTMPRQGMSWPSRRAAAAVLHEATQALAHRLSEFAAEFPVLQRPAAALLRWEPPGGEPPATVVAAAPPASTAAVSAIPTIAATAPTVEVAVGHSVSLRFDTSRCIHARHCVTGEPEVFLANTPGTWIFPDRATPERLALVAHNCPSGAITYERCDGQPGEAAPRVNLLRVREAGPLAVHADVRLTHADGREESFFRATLCRCGHSSHKPFCDSSHLTAGGGEGGAVPFTASGEAATRPSEPLAVRNGPLQIEPLRNGPLEVHGPLEVCCGTGRTIDRVVTARLCRCGQSRDKPFCDGSHAVVGFVAAGR
jgi:CDGSH-type Zn-finger protein/uncharacterized Fe-S cluster protein YjdI